MRDRGAAGLGRFTRKNLRTLMSEDYRERFALSGNDGVAEPYHFRRVLMQEGPADSMEAEGESSSSAVDSMPDAGASWHHSNPRMKTDHLTTDEFHKLIHKIIASKPLLDGWREGFARCQEHVSTLLANTFNQHRHHDPRPKPLIDQAALSHALGDFPPHPLAGNPFTRFVGRAEGTTHVYNLGTGGESRRFTNFSHFDKTEEIDGALVQRITIGLSKFHPPRSLSHVHSAREVDVVISLYREDLGITSWLSSRRFGDGETVFLCYPLNADHIVWISKEIPVDGRPLDNVFIISTEWWTRSKLGGKRYSVIAASFAVDFEHCSAHMVGDKIIETYFLDHQPLAEERLPIAPPITGQGPIVAFSSLAAATVGAALFIASVPLLAILALFQFSAARTANSQDTK